MDFGKEFKKFATKDQGISSTYYNDIISSMFPRGLTPNIIEERQMNIAIFDVFSRLMMDRIIFMGTAINDQVANIIQAQLLFLESTDSTKDIQIYINSPGGSVYAGLGIYDTMQLIKPDVATICTGMAASMGAVLLCAGEKGKTNDGPPQIKARCAWKGRSTGCFPKAYKACEENAWRTSREMHGLPFAKHMAYEIGNIRNIRAEPDRISTRSSES